MDNNQNSYTTSSSPFTSANINKPIYPPWFVILLFLVFHPAAWYFMFKDKWYHRWFPILFWFYASISLVSYLSISIFVVPQLDLLYKNLGNVVPSNIAFTYALLIFFIFLSLAQIIFGFILKRKVKDQGELKGNFFWISLVLLISVGVGPAIVIVNVVKPIYYLVSKVGSSPTQIACPQDAKQCPDGSYISRTGPNCSFAPCPAVKPTSSVDETANWKTYKNTKRSYELKYPPGWKIIYADDSPIAPYTVFAGSGQTSILVISPISSTTYESSDKVPYFNEAKLTTFAGLSAKEVSSRLIKNSDGEYYFRYIEIEDVRDIPWSKPNEISYKVDKNDSTDLNTADQILSTFKFLDQTQTNQ